MTWILIGYNTFLGSTTFRVLRSKTTRIFGAKHTDQVRDILRNVNNITGIINCGGMTRSSDGSFIDSQVGTIEQMLSCLRFSKTTPAVIQISGERVYGQEREGIGSFANSKLQAESLLLQDWDDSWLCILRPSQVYGAGCRMYKDSIFGSWLQSAVDDTPLHIQKGSKVKKNWIHVNNFEEVLSSVIDHFVAQQHNTSIEAPETTSLYSHMDDATKPVFMREKFCNKLPNIIDVRSNDLHSIEEVASVLAEISETSPKFTVDSEEIAMDSPTKAGWHAGAVNAIECGLINNYLKIEQGLSKTWKATKNQIIPDIISQKCNKSEQGHTLDLFKPPLSRVYEVGLNPGTIIGEKVYPELEQQFCVRQGRVLFELSSAKNEEEGLTEARTYIELSSQLYSPTSLSVPSRVVHSLWNPSAFSTASAVVAESVHDTNKE